MGFAALLALPAQCHPAQLIQVYYGLGGLLYRIYLEWF
jgi:hypothetical protein